MWNSVHAGNNKCVIFDDLSQLIGESSENDRIDPVQWQTVGRLLADF